MLRWAGKAIVLCPPKLQRRRFTTSPLPSLPVTGIVNLVEGSADIGGTRTESAMRMAQRAGSRWRAADEQELRQAEFRSRPALQQALRPRPPTADPLHPCFQQLP